MKRRSFLKTVSGAVGAGAVGTSTVGVSVGQAQQGTVLVSPAAVEGIPRRLLGRTGERVSIVGFPGLSLMRDEQEICTNALHSAFDRGINYFDVAPAYGKNGICEIRMGEGLQGLDRSKYFLSCKTKMRDAKGCQEELDRSLQRLKTDHFDLYQLHCLFTADEVRKALGPGGAMETVLKAKEQGKIRFVGFSAHTTQAAITALNEFSFDTAMFPISFAEYFILGFGKPVLELAKKQGAAVVAIKPLCRGAWPAGLARKDRPRQWWYPVTEDQEELSMALRFTLSQEPVVTGIPPAWIDLVDKAITAAKSYSPITEEETNRLREIASQSESLFRKEEARVAYGCEHHGPAFPDCSHERLA